MAAYQSLILARGPWVVLCWDPGSPICLSHLTNALRFPQFSLYSTAESAALYTDYSTSSGNEVDEGQFIGHKCEKLEVCAVVPYGRALQMTIMDNWCVPAVCHDVLMIDASTLGQHML